MEYVKAAYYRLEGISNSIGRNLPENSANSLQRFLDCAVIESLHKVRKESGKPALDTVRGVFIEGKPLFPRSGIYEKTHIQIAVRNSDCIKGMFQVHPRYLK